MIRLWRDARRSLCHAPSIYHENGDSIQGNIRPLGSSLTYPTTTGIHGEESCICGYVPALCQRHVSETPHISEMSVRGLVEEQYMSKIP